MGLKCSPGQSHGQPPQIRTLAGFGEGQGVWAASAELLAKKEREEVRSPLPGCPALVPKPAGCCGEFN